MAGSSRPWRPSPRDELRINRRRWLLGLAMALALLPPRKPASGPTR